MWGFLTPTAKKEITPISKPNSNPNTNTYTTNPNSRTHTYPYSTSNSISYTNLNSNISTNEINKILQDLSNSVLSLLQQNSRTTIDILNDLGTRIGQQNRLIKLLLAENMELRRKVGNNFCSSSPFVPFTDLDLNPQIIKQWESSISSQPSYAPLQSYAQSDPYSCSTSLSSQAAFQQPPFLQHSQLPTPVWNINPTIPISAPALRPKPPKEVNILKRVEGTIMCAGKITERIFSHEIFSKNSMQINFVTGPPYEIVLLFYRVLGRVDPEDLKKISQEEKGKKVIAIFMYYEPDATKNRESEPFVVDSAKELVAGMVDMTFQDGVLHEGNVQNSSAILRIVQKIQQLAG